MVPLNGFRYFIATKTKEIQVPVRAIHGYGGRSAVAYALKLAPLLFVRPGERRAAEWSEIDFGERIWRIAAHRMQIGER